MSLPFGNTRRIEDFCTYCGNPGTLEGCGTCMERLIGWITVDWEIECLAK